MMSNNTGMNNINSFIDRWLLFLRHFNLKSIACQHFFLEEVISDCQLLQFKWNIVAQSLKHRFEWIITWFFYQNLFFDLSEMARIFIFVHTHILFLLPWIVCRSIVISRICFLLAEIQTVAVVALLPFYP